MHNFGTSIAGIFLQSGWQNLRTLTLQTLLDYGRTRSDRMLYRALRDWLARADEVGELKRVDGADWNLEVGAVAEVAQRLDHSPAVLFDNIRGYPQGRRILTRVHNPTLKRPCLTNHLPLDCDRGRFIQAWKERLNNRRMIPPRVVADGPRRNHA